jgi:hypothetical protein
LNNIGSQSFSADRIDHHGCKSTGEKYSRCAPSNATQELLRRFNLGLTAVLRVIGTEVAPMHPIAR